MRDVNDDVSVYSDYAILNLYLLRTIKSGDVTIQNYGLVDNDDTLSYYITFLKSINFDQLSCKMELLRIDTLYASLNKA